MDLNDFRSLTTVLGLVCFLGIVAWAYSKRARQGFEEAARLPFDDDEPASDGGRPAKEGKNG